MNIRHLNSHKATHGVVSLIPERGSPIMASPPMNDPTTDTSTAVLATSALIHSVPMSDAAAAITATAHPASPSTISLPSDVSTMASPATFPRLITESDKPLDRFEIFNELPAELRLRIWKLVPQLPRFVEVRFTTDDPADNTLLF